MKRTSLLGVLLICLLFGTASAITRNVPSEYGSIQAAINASGEGDVVVVGPGVYFERIDFEGKDITVTSTDPNDPRVVGYTVLNGEGEGSVVSFTGGETARAVLAGFTITGGYGTVNPEISEGGQRLYMGAGVYCNRSSPTITRNVIVRNEGPFVIDFNTGQVDFTYGGGIGAWECGPTITYNTIRNNKAYVGGGIIIFYGESTIHNNMIYENSSTVAGGLVAFAGHVYNNTIVRNDGDLAVEMGIPDVGGAVGGNLYMVFAPEFGAARVFNNIIAEAPSGGGFVWQGDPETGYVAYNNVWNNSPGNYGPIDDQTGTISQFDGDFDQTGKKGNLSQNPLFFASLSRDFHITLDSPCINAGDPDFIPPAGQTDVDGEERVYASRIDVGADEYVGYVKPVAEAGIDVHVLEPLEAVTLDGSESFFYDPLDIQTYQWTQVSGPNAVLAGADSATPTFNPPEMGEYVFELVVADSQYSSAPDDVLVFVGANQLPVADAGAGRVWQMPGRVTLDGTGSYDPDPVDQDRLVYLWTQVEGPAVSLENGETAKATFVGEPGAIYVFELVVSDGFGNSEPSQVRMVAVGGTFDMQALEISALDGLYPHYLDISGTRAVFAADTGQGYSWRIGLGEMATGEMETFSNSGLNTQPKIEGNVVVWTGGARFSNNIVTRECTSVLARDLRGDDIVTLRERSDTQSFSHPAISGSTVVWVQHVNIDKNVAGQWNNTPYDICGADISDLANPVYFTIATGVGQRDPLPLDDLLNDYDDVVEIDGHIVVWEGDGDIYAADISSLDDIRVFTVCDDEGRQSDPAVSGSYVVWMDERDDEGDIYGADISDLDDIRVFEVIKDQRAQRQPTIDGSLVACVQGEVTGGRIRMACITRNYGVMQLDVPDGSYALGPVFDGSYLAWLRGTYGPIAGSRVAFGYSIHDGVIENVTTGERYDYIQHAISGAEAGGEIVVPAGVHDEEINFVGKAVTVRSTAPDDPAVVAATILTGDGQIVTCGEGESDASVLDGLTISGGSRGVFLSEGSPTIKRCTIASNRGSGMFMVNGSRPELIECHIVANEGDGIAMWYPADRRTVRHSQPTLRNCVVAGNDGAGVQGGKVVVQNSTIAENRREGVQCIAPTVANSIVYFNDAGGAGVQVGDDRADVTYSDIEGGWSGEGNLDVDPAFAQLGRGLDGSWLAGDYHLQGQGGRWDASAGQWVFDAVTSPCVDAGDPAAPLLEEPLSVPGASIINERVNMGAYGGTREASVASAGN